MFGKRGVFGFHELIFIVLNVIFFSAMLFFVYNVSTGALVYEQAYSKQVALLLDKSKAFMTLKINFEEAINVAEKIKGRKLSQGEKKDLVKIDYNNREVIVKLGDNGGYATKYFSNYDIRSFVDSKENLLILIVEEKSNGVS